jgi:hypothetical protein
VLSTRIARILRITPIFKASLGLRVVNAFTTAEIAEYAEKIYKNSAFFARSAVKKPELPPYTKEPL